MYKKIDIYRKVKGGFEYLCSTTQAKNLLIAKHRYEKLFGINKNELSANYA